MKKISQNFVLFITFLQSCYATHCKGQNKKKELWKLVKKQNSYSKYKNVKKMPKKLQNF